ncbi:unnamed protein product [Trichobilharzia szidati]|nr:unnamed protein product [Trichobilharzia szidati]
MERTFIMVKPDGVQRGLVGEIVHRFERRGYKLVALKMTQASEQLLHTHYEALKSKPFFPKLIAYMSSGPVVPMVFEGHKLALPSRLQMILTYIAHGHHEILF